MNGKLAVATGTRAEYGIMRPLLREFQHRGWPFDLYVTGAHLTAQHGLTVKEIEADGFEIAARVDMLLSADSPSAVCKSMGLALIGFADVLERARPDLLFLLGDRFEALAVAAAAQVMGVPVAHIHGGEVSEGAIDDAFRHAITKLSRVHFVSAEIHRRRVVQLGEAADTVFNVGALALDNIASIGSLDREAVERALGIRLREENILVTHHPLTTDPARSAEDVRELLAALSRFPSAAIIFTSANADAGGADINAMIKGVVATDPRRMTLVQSLGTKLYFSLLRIVNVVVGNSSSGLIEAPSFGTPTVNVGDRQKGRLSGPSVISVPAEADAIAGAINRALTPSFRNSLSDTQNPYGQGDAATSICDVVASLRFPLSPGKSFQDAFDNP